MRMIEVCQSTGLTKKAINWYEQQGLIHIRTGENGYRDFTGSDIEQLKEIGLLRGLGLSAKEIKIVLDAGDKSSALMPICIQKQRDLEHQQLRLELLKKLSDCYTVEKIEQLRQEWNSAPIGQKLQTAFPGMFGRILFQHFFPYLQEPIQTPEQQNAYETICSFLDAMEVKIPLTVRLADHLWGEAYERVNFDPNAGVNRILNASEEELENFKKVVLREAKQRQRWTSRLNPLLRAHWTLRKRLTAAGYYDVLLPNLKILSPSYAAYTARLEEFNRVVCENQGIHYDDHGRIVIDP